MAEIKPKAPQTSATAISEIETTVEAALAPERKPIEHYLGTLKPWEAAVVKTHLNAPQGYELTQADFDAARKEALGAEL